MCHLPAFPYCPFAAEPDLVIEGGQLRSVITADGKEFDADGRLVYGTWSDTLPTLFPMYVVRGLGGVLFLLGSIIMCYNLWMTVRKAPAKEASLSVAVPAE